jgi:hypothetical protein
VSFRVSFNGQKNFYEKLAKKRKKSENRNIVLEATCDLMVSSFRISFWSTALLVPEILRGPKLLSAKCLGSAVCRQASGFGMFLSALSGNGMSMLNPN